MKQDGYDNAGIHNIVPRFQTNSIDSGFLPIHPYFDDMYNSINENEIFLTSSGTNNWEDVRFVNMVGPINVEEATIMLNHFIG